MIKLIFAGLFPRFDSCWLLTGFVPTKSQVGQIGAAQSNGLRRLQWLRGEAGRVQSFREG